MDNISSLISILFIIGSFISIYWGIYRIRLNLKSSINRIFLLLCIALSIWSFGFAMANIVSTLEAALFWRRFASIGMTSIFSLILHFLLLLTRQNQQPSRLLYFLHIPALVCMYIFTFSPTKGRTQYELVQTAYGLTNIAPNSIWNYFYYAYYSIYMVLAMAIVWKWKFKIKDKAAKRQSNIIVGAIVTAAILGSLTDIISSTYMLTPLPQIAPLFILIPVGSMHYSARYYGLMDIDEVYSQEIIVTKEDQKKIFQSLSLAFYIAGILAFIAEYMPYRGVENSFKLALAKSMTLIIIGININLIQNIKDESLKENMTILVLVVSIPLATLQFVRYGTITVWAFPMVIIISSVIFSNLTLLIATTVVAIITQVVIWSLSPTTTVIVDKYDFSLRIGMFIVAFFIGLQINKMYVDKIKKNKYKLALQEMISDISFELVSLNQDNFNMKTDYLLEKIGTFFNSDRIYLFTIDYSNNTMTYSNEWCNKGIKEELGTINKIPLEVFPWWIRELDKNGLVYIEDVYSMPKEAREEQKQLLRQEVKSLISVAVRGEGKMQAFIGIDSVLENKKWSREKIDMLNITANIISSGMKQMAGDKEVEFMAYYDNLTKLPNRFLFEDRLNQAISLAERTGKYVAIIFIDLDNFKTVNDTIGHKGGDILLKKVARSLKGAVRKSDAVARFGGDEFMIMVNNITDYKTITNIADKIINIFSDLFEIRGEKFSVTASAGIAVYPLDGKDSETLIENADIAMYDAKVRGRNQYALASEEIKHINSSKLN